MVQRAPLIIGSDLRADLVRLRSAAAAKPLDMRRVIEDLRTEAGRDRHRAVMDRQTIVIPGPWPFYVTFTIETGHPAGVCRHMSMSASRDSRVPTMEAVWMVGKELGFVGGYDLCRIWLEPLPDGRAAVNMVQPLSVAPSSAA
jgi:hypothetical protein